MSLLDENLNPREPSLQSRTSDNRKHIETTVLSLKKKDFQGFLGIDVSQEGKGGLKETSKGHFSGKN